VNRLFRAAVDLQAFAASRGWKCCVIEGLAVQRWGEPRQTRDVDITLLTGIGGEERFIDPILSHYRARLSEARRFALDRRVVLVETADGVPMDISLGGLPFEARVVERASPFAIEATVSLVTCSAEDLIALKVFAGRLQDWLDVEGIVVRQGGGLNRMLVLDEVRPLLALKEDDEAETRLMKMFEKHPAGPDDRAD
jgi:hypothetical protein